MDNELFELCKEVYEKTGWGIRILPEETIMGVKYPKTLQPLFLPMYQNGKVIGDEMFDSCEIENTVPLYTSDYLLDKLPTNTQLHSFLINKSDGVKWQAELYTEDKSHYRVADTPLKALLKLTLALQEAGEL